MGWKQSVRPSFRNKLKARCWSTKVHYKDRGSTYQLDVGHSSSYNQFCQLTLIREIDQGLSLLWRNNIPPSKVVLGLGFYGRSFTLSNPSCNTPGCAFASGGTAGSCTNASGILSDAEIQRVIKQYDLNPILDAGAGVKYMSWNSVRLSLSVFSLI
jgi:GH18 family chitinase